MIESANVHIGASQTAVAFAKAQDLVSLLPSRLTSVRILTDVRPIFGDDVSSQPKGALLVHTVVFAYSDGDVSVRQTPS